MNKKVELYVNSTKPKAMLLSKKIEEELISQGYEIVEEEADIIIGLGGDGTLLNLLRERNYSISSKYIGVNCGTLGFLQDFEVENVENFVRNISNYVEKDLSFLNICIRKGNAVYEFNALNEVMVQDGEDKAFRTNVYIENEFLEKFVGTGIIFSSSTGSTAMNLSAGGAIIHSGLDVIQMTPREAIANSKMHCLPKSICIPKEMDISLWPNASDKIKIYADGACVYSGEYDKVQVYYSDKYMTKLQSAESNFIKTIREKLI